MNAPLLKLTGLWQRVSAKGTVYFVGRLGGAKLLILPNQDAAGDPDQPSHHVFVTEPAERPAKTERPDQAPIARKYRNAYRHLQSAPRRDEPAGDGRPFDDPLPPQMK